MSTQADDIHAAIRSAISGGTFARISYPNGVRTTSISETEEPKTILVKPVSSTWSTPVRNRQRSFLERSSWQWEATVEFNREVSLEQFEDDNTNTLLRIERTATKPQVDLIFEEAEYRHPPEQQAGSGTRVVYRIRAETTPL